MATACVTTTSSTQGVTLHYGYVRLRRCAKRRTKLGRSELISKNLVLEPKTSPKQLLFRKRCLGKSHENFDNLWNPRQRGEVIISIQSRSDEEILWLKQKGCHFCGFLMSSCYWMPPADVYILESLIHETWNIMESFPHPLSIWIIITMKNIKNITSIIIIIIIIIVLLPYFQLHNHKSMYIYIYKWSPRNDRSFSRYLQPTSCRLCISRTSIFSGFCPPSKRSAISTEGMQWLFQFHCASVLFSDLTCQFYLVTQNSDEFWWDVSVFTIDSRSAIEIGRRRLENCKRSKVTTSGRGLFCQQARQLMVLKREQSLTWRL